MDAAGCEFDNSCCLQCPSWFKLSLKIVNCPFGLKCIKMSNELNFFFLIHLCALKRKVDFFFCRFDRYIHIWHVYTMPTLLKVYSRTFILKPDTHSSFVPGNEWGYVSKIQFAIELCSGHGISKNWLFWKHNFIVIYYTLWNEQLFSSC